MVLMGIDYSLTSPALCIYDDNGAKQWDYKKCKFYYLSSMLKILVVNNRYDGKLYPAYKNDEDRYDKLSQWVIDVAKKHAVEKVYLEGYAYNATGKVFNIAENTGCLKQKLFKDNINFEVFAPKDIKKMATNNGNANKEKMYESFLSETQIDIRKDINITALKQWNPISDIVDSYFITKRGFLKNI